MKKKVRLDWEKIHEEELMKRRGVENYNYKKPYTAIISIKCTFCGSTLKNNSEQVEKEHLQNCLRYLQAVKEGRIKNELGLYARQSSGVPLQKYSNEPNFPFCTMGKIIATKYFSGKVVKIENGDKITLVNDVGVEKQFRIKILLEQNKE